VAHQFARRLDGKASRDDVRASRSHSSVGFGNCPAESGRLVFAARNARRDGTSDPETATTCFPSRIGGGRPCRFPTPAPPLQRFKTGRRRSNPHSASLTLTAAQHSAVSSLGLCPTPAHWPRRGVPTSSRLGRRRTTLNMTRRSGLPSNLNGSGVVRVWRMAAIRRAN
jgi:hypothetical protein